MQPLLKILSLADVEASVFLRLKEVNVKHVIAFKKQNACLKKIKQAHCTPNPEDSGEPLSSRVSGCPRPLDDGSVYKKFLYFKNCKKLLSKTKGE